MIFDTHAHCYWATLEPKIDEIVENMLQNGVVKATQIWCDVKTSTKAIQLALRFPSVFFATVWLHPETAQDTDILSTAGELESLILENRECIVWIGETWLDYHYLDGSNGGNFPIDLSNLTERAVAQIERQKYWWRIQHGLAKKYHLPLIIHTRDARDATLAFMKEEKVISAVMHCFSEDWEFAEELLDFSDGIYFSFSGIVTYKNAIKVQEAAKKIPLSRILVETDAPFLAPQGVRGQINEPAFTRYTLEKIAELRSIPIEDIEKHIFENSLRFYQVKD